MKPFPLVVCVAALVVLAGCPSTAHEETPDGTVTPAPVPTTVQSPPGVATTGVSGPDLAAAHRRALERTNYTIVIRQRIVGPDGTIQRINGTRRVLAGGKPFAGQYERSIRESPLVEFVPPEMLEYVQENSIRQFPIAESTGRIEYWTDGDRFGARDRESGRIIYLDEAETEQLITDVSGARSIDRTVRALRFAVTRPANGTVALVVTGSRDLDALPTPAYVHGAHNVSGTVRVRTDGLVTDSRLVYDAELGDRSVRVIQEIHVRNLGSTSVERPDWIETARNRSGS